MHFGRRVCTARLIQLDSLADRRSPAGRVTEKLRASQQDRAGARSAAGANNRWGH